MGSLLPMGNKKFWLITMERSAVNENILIRLLSSLNPLYVSFYPQTIYVYHKTQHLQP